MARSRRPSGVDASGASSSRDISSTERWAGTFCSRFGATAIAAREGDELRQVALVRGDRVGRRVAVQADVVEKLAELFHRARSSSARSDVASFLSARPGFFSPDGLSRTKSRGGDALMPNVMLVGW